MQNERTHDNVSRREGEPRAERRQCTECSKVERKRSALAKGRVHLARYERELSMRSLEYDCEYVPYASIPQSTSTK